MGKLVSQCFTMKCDQCNKVFSRKSNLVRHMRKSCPLREPPSRKKLKLCVCGDDASHTTRLGRKRLHLPVSHKVEKGVEKLQHAFKNRISSYRFSSEHTHINPTEFLETVKPKVCALLSEYVGTHNSMKVNFELFGIYIVPEKGLAEIKAFNTKNKVVNTSTDVNELYTRFKEEMLSQASDFQTRDSGWTLEKVIFLHVNINKFTPLAGSSYIKLPKQLAAKHAVLNMHNNDQFCFAHCIMASLFRANGNPHETSSYPHFTSVLRFEGIEFPMKLTDIHKFEEMNTISVNVFGTASKFQDGRYITDIVGPLYFTTARQPTHVNLLLLSDNDGNKHYCLITDLSRLVSKQKSRHNGRVYICDGCLQFFHTLENLQAHEKHDCNHLVTKVPTTKLLLNKYGELLPENILKFINFERQLAVPFVIYADFESLLKPIHHSEPCSSTSFTLDAYEHEPYSFAFYVKCNYNDDYSKLHIYRGADAAEVFSKKLDEVVLELYSTYLRHVKPMLPLTKEEEKCFQDSTHCNICDKPFTPIDVKVREHCHLTGQWRRGAAHQTCNLHYKLPKFIPVFFHNLINYDCHLFIKKLCLNGESIGVIAQSKEKYVSFSKSILVEKSHNPQLPDTYIRLRFVDSFRFLGKSLDNLSKTLESGQCREVRRYFSEEDKFNLIRQKGVFPYTYVDSLEKLEDMSLPPKEKFYNSLTGEAISEVDYARAEEVWQTFQCSTLGEYSDLYLTSDVLLLADIFENFRNVCLDTYKLDPAQYITAPSLSWDAMLRYTQVELELLTDIDMLHFLKKGVRGGVTQCSKRKSHANNAFLDTYDASQPATYIMYLDATNLYGYAMSQPLPQGGFRWLEQKEIATFDCTLVKNDSHNGYVLEVDLDYPAQLHYAHNDLPFCPENFLPPGSKHPKLIPNLNAKTKYVIHYENLKQCLHYGLKLRKTHRILEFAQSAWLKPYIELNTSLRNSARNDFEKDLFKFIINSIFGKTLENVDKRCDVKLCTHWENRRNSPGAVGLIAKPHFKSCAIFDETLVAIEMERVEVCYNKPIYVGFSILDISKTVIYDFYYGFIKYKYGDNASLLYTDTDSLILEITTDNVYQDMGAHIELFDTSNYSEHNVHGMPRTLSIIGKMKDEYAGEPIKSFYGTAAKAYCVEATNLMKKAKGVSKYVIKNELQLSDYVQVVEKGGSIFRKMYVFTSQLHNMHTQLKNKIALSSSDDKRFLLPGNIKTLAWGHKDIISPNTDRNLDVFLEIATPLLEDSYVDNFDVALLD